MSTENEGSQRLLTAGEIRLAKQVFENTIPYSKVWIHHGSYLPLGLQSENVAMSPNGEIYFRDLYCEDFSTQPLHMQHLFIHEMAHVWQREKGMWVRARGMFSWLANYHYRLDKRTLRQYPMEQQAQIIADGYILAKYGYGTWVTLKTNNVVSYAGVAFEADIRTQYAHALRAFPRG